MEKIQGTLCVSYNPWEILLDIESYRGSVVENIRSWGQFSTSASTIRDFG